MDRFDRILSSVIDSHLGLRSKLIGYQYSEIIRAVFSVFCCGGDCMEDLNLYLKDALTECPHTCVPSADTVLRGIEELAGSRIRPSDGHITLQVTHKYAVYLTAIHAFDGDGRAETVADCCYGRCVC